MCVGVCVGVGVGGVWVCKWVGWKVIKQPKSFSFLLLLLQMGQFKIAWLFHNGFHTKQRHFTLSSAPTHHFFFFKVSQGSSNWSLYEELCVFICSAISLTCMHVHKSLSNESKSFLKITELELRLVCMETGKGFVCKKVCSMYYGWEVTLLQVYNQRLTERISTVQCFAQQVWGIQTTEYCNQFTT